MRRVFVVALALLLPACAEVQTGTVEAERTVARVSPAGPISIIYRDDESNERILNGVVSYDSVLGRDRAVHFTIKNQSAELVCDGTFTKEGRTPASSRCRTSTAISAATANTKERQATRTTASSPMARPRVAFQLCW
jgi:hypothetical protein